MLVALALGGWLLHSGALDPSRLGAALVAPAQLAGLTATLGCMAVQGLRWWGLLRAQGVEVSAARVLQIYWTSQFLALVLSSSGGEVVRAVQVAGAHPAGKLRAVGTVVVDKLVGLHTLLLLGALAAGPALVSGDLASERGRLGLVVGGLFLVSTVGMLVLTRVHRIARFLGHRVPALGTRLDHVLPEDFELRGMPRAYLFSAGASGALFLSYGAAFAALGQPLSVTDLVAVVPLVTLVNSLPISPGGLGAGEAASHLLFLELGVPAGAEAALLVRFWALLVRLVGGVAYLRAVPGEGSS
jgi:uncharacterized membrane protein YbhN (UPF0104 family)